MGYPNDLLSTRAIVKPGLWALIPQTGLVNNVIPGIEKARISIVASPKMGASFVQYVIELEEQGGTSTPFGGQELIETFLYCISGQLTVEIGEKKTVLGPGGYAYSGPCDAVSFYNNQKEPIKLLLYKQRYQLLDGEKPPKASSLFGDVNQIEYRIYDEMENVMIKDLLPADHAYDMNMHILAFKPGGSHPFAETHVQEHGAYILSGQGMYYMDQQWLGVKKDDFMWFGPYVPQCAYGTGRELFSYIYSKDCNRDVIL